MWISRWSSDVCSSDLPDVAGPVRPDLAAARSELPLRVLGQDHTVAGANPLRAPQGADLSAHRLTLSSRRLSVHRQENRPGPGRWGVLRRGQRAAVRQAALRPALDQTQPPDIRRQKGLDRKSVVQGKRVSVRVGLGGRRIIKKKRNTKKNNVNHR